MAGVSRKRGEMSIRLGRRGMIRGCAAALLPVFVSPTILRAAEPRGPIVLPGGPMLFSRSLQREMAGGHLLVARREFELDFERRGDGILVRGEQVSSQVEAPPSLAAFARIEEQRVEEGMFPLELGGDGLIRSGPDAVPGATLEQAVEMALEFIRERVEDQAQRREIGAFILALEQAAGQISSAMPVNLFVPPKIPRRIARELALPGGGTGSLTSEFSGAIDPGTGLMREAERTVLTESGTTRRLTLERWSLTPAA